MKHCCSAEWNPGSLVIQPLRHPWPSGGFAPDPSSWLQASSKYTFLVRSLMLSGVFGLTHFTLGGLWCLVLIVNLTQSRIFRKSLLNEEISRLVGLWASLGLIFLNWVNWAGLGSAGQVSACSLLSALHGGCYVRSGFRFLPCWFPEMVALWAKLLLGYFTTEAVF